MASELPRSSPKESRHGMCLPLNLEDQNNAFLPESSMSCTPYERGETSPDSMRSLSSLSSTRTDSPVDVDMSELEMGKLTANSDDSGIQSPDCRPMTSESNDNDNSVSVYLDANEDCWSDDENHNVTLVLEKKVDHLEEWSMFSENEDNAHASEEREEDLFLSISSEDLIMNSQASNQETDNLNEAELSCGEPGDDKIYTSVTTTEIFSSIQELSKSTHFPGDVLPKPHLKASSIKPTNHDVKRSFRPDLRNVKAKIISRPTQPIKTSTNLNHPASNKVKVSLSSSRTSKKCKTVEKSRSSSSHEKEAELMSQTCEDLQLADLMTSLANREEAQKQPESQSADLLDEENPQFKNKPEELPKNIRKTVSSKLGPSNAATSRPPESRLKQSSRDAKPTGGPGPPGGRVAQSAGVPRMRLTEKSLLPCGSPSVSSSKGLQKVASSKLPIKGLCSPTHAGSETISPAANKVHDEVIKSEDKSIKQSPSSSSSSSSSPVHAKTVTNKLTSGHRSKTSYTLSTKPATGLKAHAVASNITTKTTQNALPRNGAARLVRAMGTAVDKSSKGPKPAGTTAGRTAPHNPAGQSEEEDERDLRLQNEKKNQCILQLRKLIINGNRRLESLALVVQHIFREREVAIKQKEALSIQLSSLREQLGNSVSCCEQLEKEKEEVRVSLEALLQKLEEQHQTELQQLEERLNEFYSAEWDKTHQAYQDEADKCRELMQQQVDDVRNKQEALRNQQEVAHTEQIKTLKHENETTLADLRKTHELHVQELDKTIKQSEAILNEKIQTLTAENEILKEKLEEEEEWRRAAAEKSQKDAHTLYLEQELESLRAVLEIKTNQMHQQDKKLMQMDKLIEDNLKMEECLKKVQQENEDYKARMDKHAALSKQLSSEQALLQQTLQKESKVNKRLSMENEELLWKLHNGDLCSPRHLSSSSPFSSPRNSASFSTSPLSPR